LSHETPDRGEARNGLQKEGFNGMRKYFPAVILTGIALNFFAGFIFAEVDQGGKYHFTIACQKKSCSLNGIMRGAETQWLFVEVKNYSVDRKLMKQLLDVLEKPAINSLDVKRLGVTPSWLRENAGPALEMYRSAHPDLSPTAEQKELFLRSLRMFSCSKKSFGNITVPRSRTIIPE